VREQTTLPFPFDKHTRERNVGTEFSVLSQSLRMPRLEPATNARSSHCPKSEWIVFTPTSVPIFRHGTQAQVVRGPRRR
jgi:hypothetical protein